MTTTMPALTVSQIDTWRATGHLHLPGLIPGSEIAAIATAIDALPERHRDLIDPNNNRFEFAGGRIWKWDPITDLCPEIAALARDPRILEAVAALYDGREPLLFKDKLIVKPSGTRGNDLHQDYTWWQGFPTSLLTVTISIDAGTRANGCTQIYPGLHTRGLLHPAGKVEFLPDAAVAGTEPLYFESQPGDVAIFHCFTPHRAGVNTSGRDRRQLFLTYNDSRDGDHYAAHYRHFNGYRNDAVPEAERAGRHLR